MAAILFRWGLRGGAHQGGVKKRPEPLPVAACLIYPRDEACEKTVFRLYTGVYYINLYCNCYQFSVKPVVIEVDW